MSLRRPAKNQPENFEFNSSSLDAANKIISKYPEGKVPVRDILKDIVMAYKLGVKTLYYHNTRDGASDAQGDIAKDDGGCDGGGCKI